MLRPRSSAAFMTSKGGGTTGAQRRSMPRGARWPPRNSPALMTTARAATRARRMTGPRQRRSMSPRAGALSPVAGQRARAAPERGHTRVFERRSNSAAARRALWLVALGEARAQAGPQGESARSRSSARDPLPFGGLQQATHELARLATEFKSGNLDHMLRPRSSAAFMTSKGGGTTGAQRRSMPRGRA